MEWFYEKNGAQQGPVSESLLKQLVANGTIGPNNLVWRQGMSDWAPYSSVFTETRALQGPPDDLIEPIQHTRAPGEVTTAAERSPRSRGTRGMTPNSKIREKALEALSGNWGSAVLVMFIFALLQQFGAIIPVLGPIVQWIIIGPLMLGFYAFFAGLHRGESVEVGLLFSGFSSFGRGLGIYVVTTLIIGGVVFLAIAPGAVLIALAHTGDYPVPEESPLFVVGIFAVVLMGIAASVYIYLRYALVYLVANDHPELGVLDSIKRSTQIVKGYKGKLFFLWLSFIGWHLLGLMALFVGLLWSMTYMFAATAAFYDDLKEE
jgi:uncharacterized membrane protein